MTDLDKQEKTHDFNIHRTRCTCDSLKLLGLEFFTSGNFSGLREIGRHPISMAGDIVDYECPKCGRIVSVEECHIRFPSNRIKYDSGSLKPQYY